MKFITFWIPLEYSIDFEKNFTIKENKISKDITDGVEKSSNNLCLEIDENKNLKAIYQKESIVLEFYKYSKDGFFTYKTEDRLDEELLKVQIYHLFKEFYHIHKSHDKEEDSLIEAIIQENYDILEVKQHYINMYISKFENYELILNEYLSIVSLEKFDYKIDNINSLKILLLKAKNELNFAKFISKQDINFEKFISFQNSFEDLYNKLSIFETNKIIKTNDNINKWQFVLAFLGIILGVVGALFGFQGASEKLQIEILEKINLIK